MLGLCGNLLRTKEPPKTQPVLIRIVRGEETLTAAIQTPPMNLVITYADEEQLTILAEHLFETGTKFPGVVGPAAASETFSSIWSKMTGAKATLGMGQKIYKVEKVTLPATKGVFRLAEAHEVDLIAQWLVEFGNESLPPPERKSFEERKPHAARAIENQLAYVWTVDETPVSMAHVGRPTENGISVSAVYTPRHLRKNGYASAVVAHLSQKMLDSGKKFCVLYTDLSNPTSNKIYQNVGYQDVSDSKHFLFEERQESRSHQGKQKREIFITTPLRAAHKLRTSLDLDEANFQGIIGFAHSDPRAYFIYACLDEVTKFVTACIRWSEFLSGDGEDLNQSDPEAAKVIHRATVESVADEQQMWARKLNEMISQLILFTATNDQHFYRLYLLGTFLDQYQRLQNDFGEFYGLKNENVQHSIDDAVGQIRKLCDQHTITSFWFFSPANIENKRIKLTSAKDLFKEALKLASNDQKLILGTSYEIGYSSPSRSIHIHVGGISKPVTSASIEGELMRMSLAAMHVVALSHKLTGVAVTGEALLFEKSLAGESNSQNLFSSITNPSIEVGDLVLAHSDSICLVEEKVFSSYGYCSVKVKYLTRPLLPGVVKEWLPARHVRLGVSKATLKENLKRIFSDVGVAPEKVDLMSDEDYFNNISKTIGDMEKSGDLKLFMRRTSKSAT